jgi:putative membrane protein
MTTRLTRIIVGFGACALWAADSAARASAAAAPAPAPAPAPLNDANIVAILDEANMADSAWGNLATTMGTKADVKGFGREMMRDHHALRKAGQDLAKKLNVTPAPPSGDTLPSSAQSFQSTMSSMAKGAAWDSAYIAHEVAVHQSVLSTLQSAQGAAQDTSLKALITKAIPNIDAHLKHAQSIQSKLGGSATGDTTAKKSPDSTAGKKKP